MGVVDVEVYCYPCPHCDGYIKVQLEYPFLEYGCLHTVHHVDKDSNEVKLEEVKSRV